MKSSAEPPPLLLILAGQCGVGKSSTANTLLGQSERFLAQRSAAAVTASCCSDVIAHAGRTVRILDTPGLADPDVPADKTHHEIIRGVAEAVEESGAANVEVAILVVLSAANRVDDNALRTLGSLASCFGTSFYRRSVALWTHGDLLLQPGEEAEVGVAQRMALGLERYLSSDSDAVGAFLADVAGGSLVLSNHEPLWAPSGRTCADQLESVVALAAAVAGPAGSIAPPRPRRKEARRERQRQAAQQAARDALEEAVAEGAAEREPPSTTQQYPGLVGWIASFFTGEQGEQQQQGRGYLGASQHATWRYHQENDAASKRR